jgi:hypothetical protein
MLSPDNADEDPFDCFGDDSGSSTTSEEDSSSAELLVTKQHRHDEIKNIKAARKLVKQFNDDPVSIQQMIRPDDFEVFDAINMAAGKILRATRSYKCGEEIMREVAAMRIPNSQAAASRNEAKAKHRNIIQRSFNALHPETKEAMMNLSSCNERDDERTPLGVYDTNAFRLGDDPRGGLFLTIARMNHSCCPSAYHFWRSDLEQTLVFAARDIAIGDEICTTYGPSECLTTAGRREYLQDRFSFHCLCDMCQEGNSCGGDDRMCEINSLQEDIILLAASGNSDAALEAVERCLFLLEEQGLGSGAFVKPILHYGYQMSMATNDINKAQLYLSKELLAVRQSEGVDSPRAIEIDQEIC